MLIGKFHGLHDTEHLWENLARGNKLLVIPGLCTVAFLLAAQREIFYPQV